MRSYSFIGRGTIEDIDNFPAGLRRKEEKMETFLVKLKPPITEKCSKCDYKKSDMFRQHTYKCPNCGSSVNSVHGPIITQQPVYVEKHQGSFDYLHPQEKQNQYVFHNLPKNYKRWFVVKNEIDISNPLECAGELKNIIDAFLYNQDKEKIKEVVEYLQRVEEEQEILRAKFKIEQAIYNFYKALWQAGEEIRSEYTVVFEEEE